MMMEDWLELKMNVERNVMLKRARTARLIVIFGYTLMILAVIMLIILPCFDIRTRHLTNLTDRSKPLPLQTYYFYDTDKSPQFELTFLTQAITIFMAAVVYTSVDGFLALAMLHICGQLEIFRYRLRSLSSSKNFDNTLSNNVIAHLRLIRFSPILIPCVLRFVNFIEETFTLMMLALVFYFGIVFCLYGFLLLTIIADEDVTNLSLSRVCFTILGVITLFIHTFLYCGAGEIMAAQCEAVYRTLCDLEWYKMESKRAKNLVLLMIRTNEPFRLTAGRIFPLTMTTFCSLFKTSAGYISFLLTMRN